jgi:hypothetical protein
MILDPIRDLRRWVDGLVSWLLGMIGGIKDLLTHPGEILEGLGGLFNHDVD